MLDVATIRPDMLNLFIITLMGLVGQVFLRYITAIYPDVWPGLTSLVSGS